MSNDHNPSSVSISDNHNPMDFDYVMLTRVWCSLPEVCSGFQIPNEVLCLFAINETEEKYVYCKISLPFCFLQSCFCPLWVDQLQDMSLWTQKVCALCNLENEKSMHSRRECVFTRAVLASNPDFGQGMFQCRFESVGHTIY